jgi:hypothetical protein
MKDYQGFKNLIVFQKAFRMHFELGMEVFY